MPTNHEELWTVVKNLPTTLQIIVVFLILSNFISVPANIDSFFNASPRIDAILVAHDSINIKMEQVERFRLIAETRMDTIAMRLNRQGDIVDFLWCVNERGETPEVRELCGEIREAARRMIQARSLERR